MKKYITHYTVIFICTFLTSVQSFAQFSKSSQLGIEPSQDNIVPFSSDELEKKWKDFSLNKAWKALQSNVEAKKFRRILNKEASWGFRAVIQNDKGKKDTALLCIFDFINPSNIKQGCSMVWAKVGDRSYKAYLIFPEGETKDIDRKFEASQEWFVDESTNKVVLAHSWGRKFRRCVQRGVSVPNVETELDNGRSRIRIGDGSVVVSCPGVCLASALGCTTLAGAAATAIVISGIVTAGTGGLTTPVLVAAGGIGAAMLIGCVGTGCGACVLMCALGAI